MTTTLDIPEEVLRQAIVATGAKSAQEAVLKALEECVNRHGRVDPARQSDIIQFLGKLDGFLTQDELREMRDAE